MWPTSSLTPTICPARTGACREVLTWAEPVRQLAFTDCACMCATWHCREQIVQFIIQNTAGGVTPPPMPMNVDPLTGGSAYVPPSTGAGSSAASYGVTGGGADPFTGASSAVAASTHVPARVPLVYDAAPARDAIRRKIQELSSAVAAAGVDGAQPLSVEALAEGGALDGVLER